MSKGQVKSSGPKVPIVLFRVEMMRGTVSGARICSVLPELGKELVSLNLITPPPAVMRSVIIVQAAFCI